MALPSKFGYFGPLILKMYTTYTAIVTAALELYHYNIKIKQGPNTSSFSTAGNGT